MRRRDGASSPDDNARPDRARQPELQVLASQTLGASRELQILVISGG